MTNPTPYRNPLGYHAPQVVDNAYQNIRVQVAIPNENPHTEDDLTIQIAFTGEGIIGDYFASDGPPAATFGFTYEEFVNTIHKLDPIHGSRKRNATSRVAALSADLRELVDSEDSEYHDTLAQLLDAIDAMLSEDG